MTGRNVGGCLETLQHLRGTRWWPSFEGAILCIETNEDCSSPTHFDIMLGDYGRMGVFDQISGMLVARPYGFDAGQHDAFLEFLTNRVAPYSFPVVANMDFGHTTPMVSMPLGIEVTIDANSRVVRVDEAFAE